MDGLTAYVLSKNNVDKIEKNMTERLTAEDNTTFNYGVKDGVRGFYTDPSRADDSFIPFL